MGRDIVEIHTQACIDAGLGISGTNPEVMPGQWEFQIGPVGPPPVGDHMYVARWLLHRIAEDFDVIISFDAKPEKGDWNGAGAHTNFSTNGDARGLRRDREGRARRSAAKWELHVKNYGDDIEERLTGKHETAPWNKFSYGVSNRGASVRIPWQVARDGKGYIEDRRPNANMDPVHGHPAHHRHDLLGAGLIPPERRRRPRPARRRAPGPPGDCRSTAPRGPDLRR